VPAQRRRRVRRRPPRKPVSTGGSSSSPQRTRTWRRRRRLGGEGHQRGCLGPGLHGRELDLCRLDLEQQRRRKGGGEGAAKGVCHRSSWPVELASVLLLCIARRQRKPRRGARATPGMWRPRRVGELEAGPLPRAPSPAHRRGQGGRAGARI
jgi:hypothetical protein